MSAERQLWITSWNPLRKSTKGQIQCFVLSVKNSTTTQRTAINKVDGVSSYINYDFGAEIDEKSKEYSEEPV